jgi:hypothetical protein
MFKPAALVRLAGGRGAQASARHYGHSPEETRRHGPVFPPGPARDRAVRGRRDAVRAIPPPCLKRAGLREASAIYKG